MKKVGMSYIKQLVLEVLNTEGDLGEADIKKVEPWQQAEPITQQQIAQLLRVVNAPHVKPPPGKDTWPEGEPLSADDKQKLTLALQALARTAPK